jgi:protein arginine kinase activator
MQRGEAHVGRGPGGVRTPEELKRRLDAARLEMTAAIADEDYEGAARLRDLIRELETRLG